MCIDVYTGLRCQIVFSWELCSKKFEKYFLWFVFICRTFHFSKVIFFIATYSYIHSPSTHSLLPLFWFHAGSLMQQVKKNFRTEILVHYKSPTLSQFPLIIWYIYTHTVLYTHIVQCGWGMCEQRHVKENTHTWMDIEIKDKFHIWANVGYNRDTTPWPETQIWKFAKSRKFVNSWARRYELEHLN